MIRAISSPRKPVQDSYSAAAPAADGPTPAAVEGPSWFWLCVSSWIAMLGAIIASSPWMPRFALFMGLALTAAFPVAYLLHFSRIPRWVVNWTVFYAAVGLGALAIVKTWPAEGRQAFYGLEATFGALVRAFLWVMVFRAFAVREPLDLVLSVIPALSALILVIISFPSLAAALGTALLVGATLHLLASEHAMESRQRRRAEPTIIGVSGEGSTRKGTTLNTWPVVALVVLVAALVAAAGAPYLRGSSDLARDLQIRLAQYLANYLIQERLDYSPDPTVSLDGGPAPTGDRILLRVQCERPMNWRQQTYGVYDGQAWHKLRGPLRRAARRGQIWVADTSLVSGFRQEGAIPVRQVYQAVVPFSAVLPGLFLATHISARVMSMHTGEDGTLACSGYVRAGDSYEVISLVPAEGPAPRRSPLPPLDPDLRRAYLQLPPTLPPRVAYLARQITSTARNPYEAALAIQNYLVQEYPYDLKPKPRPSDRDFVDHFLFEARTGYCVHYASAMAVLCRTIGLPSRYVTGFVAGEYIEQKDLYEVRAKDAHSWVEVYIEGRGWQPFEPTPPQPEQSHDTPLTTVWAWLRAVGADIALFGAGLSRERGWVVSWLAVAGTFMLAAFLLRRRRGYCPPRFNGRGTSPASRVLFAYGQMLRWLAHFRLPRATSQAPLEYLASLPPALAPVYGDLESITHSYLRARYGRSGVDETEAARTEEALCRVWRGLFRQRIMRRREG